MRFDGTPLKNKHPDIANGKSLRYGRHTQRLKIQMRFDGTPLKNKHPGITNGKSL